eukprot:CAMPEP_0196764466 /NCGR_PEP_ID=MMETSP1095-20130614/6196_1 /TAXON_ID=96789 ORGANISM="Chromulina nebulosa, Strain UTEXLB2642" /NCGR_SAMPLE_ID=MMETSP1095 /ASSEMBLY_ACC=CAM_ASM_000446 /LENGTH=806 /DNA_ID=CAMNT_0042120133 /DNA_START=739 /DNA_END=3159 /DNA_ORIENTATION=-
MTATGEGCEVPILTHFASVLSDIKPINQTSSTASTNSTTSNSKNQRHNEGNTTSETNSNNNTSSLSDNSNNNNFDSSGGESNDNLRDKKRKESNHRSNQSTSGSSIQSDDVRYRKHTTHGTDADMAVLYDAMNSNSDTLNNITKVNISNIPKSHKQIIDKSKQITTNKLTIIENQNLHLFHDSKVNPLPIPSINSNINNQNNYNQINDKKDITNNSDKSATQSTSTVSSKNSNVSNNQSYDADASMSNGSESILPNSSPSSEDGQSMYDSDYNRSLSDSMTTVSPLQPGSDNNSNNNSTKDINNNSNSKNNSNDTSSVSSSNYSSVSSNQSSILPYNIVVGVNDRRAGCIRFDAQCEMSPESFFKAARTVRLSDLLRLMISCQNALLLCDRFGRILHINPAFANLFEYVLNDMEGHTLHFLYRQPSDIVLFEQCRMLNIRGESTDVTLQGFRKSGSTVYCRVITVPIRGGYRNSEISHYCSYFFPIVTTNFDNKNSNNNHMNVYPTNGPSNNNNSYNMSSNPHMDLHGILQRINSGSPLSMTTSQINIHASNNNNSSGNESKSAKTSVNSSNPPLSRGPNNNNMRPTNITSNLTAQNLSNVPSSKPFPSSSSYYSHHQQYYHHNHHDHNPQLPYTASQIQSVGPIYTPMQSTVPNSALLYYPNNDHDSNMMRPNRNEKNNHEYIHNNSHHTQSQSYNYRNNNNNNNSNLYHHSSNPIPIPSNSNSSNPMVDDYMHLSTGHSSSNSPNGSPPNVSTGLISVGGFIGGIVDSEQDHYHHSDHYHHCEDDVQSNMYSDNENEDNDNDII